MKKYITLLVLILAFPLLHGGWLDRLAGRPTQEEKGLFIEIAKTIGREEPAPDVTRYRGRSGRFYVQIVGDWVGAQSVERWYRFDGTQSSARLIQALFSGSFTWYYDESNKGGER